MSGGNVGGIASIPVSCFDLKHTFESANPLTFHADYDSSKGTISYSAKGRRLSVRSSGTPRRGNLIVESGDIKFASKEVRSRFRLSDDMEALYARINTDRFINESIKRYNGMRLTLSDPWETTLCYIISQYNNVQRIRRIVKSMISAFGDEIRDDDGNVLGRSFPESSALLGASIKDLMACGAGFRARYIKTAAEQCTYNINLDKLNPRKYHELKSSLMEIMGVGDKVADCIALMGYGNLEAFPIDVWVKRTIENAYFKGKSMKIERIHDFAEKKWGAYRGYVQQYIFWHGRQMDKEASKYIMVK